MKLYLVKDEVQIIKVTEAFSKTTKYYNHIMTVKEDNCDNSSDASDNEGSGSDNEVDRTLVKLADFPVALTSICGDGSEQSSQFAKRVEIKLTPDPKNFEWEKMKVELVIWKDQPNSLEGHLLLFSKFPADGSHLNVFKRLDEQLGFYYLEYYVDVSMCHLPTENAPASPASFVSLDTRDKMDYYSVHKHRAYSNKIKVPREILEWREEGTGFIYCKTSLHIRLTPKAVNLVYGYLDGNKRLLKDGDFTDVEIGCKSGEIVRCHRTFLADESCLLRDKFKEMLEKGQKVGPWKLEMQMGKTDVEAFLEYIYCGNVSRGVGSFNAALELLIAAREYKVVGLETAMEEIIMAKGNADFDYFSVKKALRLFLYARNVEELKHMRDKAVRVLQSFLKNQSDKIVKSKEYQDLFRNHPQVALELSSLYIQLS